MQRSAAGSPGPGSTCPSRTHRRCPGSCPVAANPASGAPLAGDAKAWAPRLAQGADILLDHSINGYQGMPPMGQCMQCSEEQFLALISFMSGHSFQ
ncbi:c-type cytochrome [Pseudomonas piscis]|uniref:c-type cytochrome n=1 Tax=Pseudomonas piscis TaxID=2614538 RepID=UPI0004091BEA